MERMSELPENLFTHLGLGAKALAQPEFTGMPGCRDTADVDGAASALFITAGLGTQHKPR
jgi:hypothetical protein